MVIFTKKRKFTNTLLASCASAFMLIGCQSMDDGPEELTENADTNKADGLELYPEHDLMRFQSLDENGYENFYLQVEGATSDSQIYQLRISSAVAEKLDILTSVGKGDVDGTSFTEETFKYLAKEYHFSLDITDGNVQLTNLAPSGEVSLISATKSGTSLADISDTDYKALDLPPQNLMDFVMEEVRGAKREKRQIEYDRLAAIEEARREANADTLKCKIHEFSRDVKWTSYDAANSLLDMADALGGPEDGTEFVQLSAGMLSFAIIVRGLFMTASAPAVAVAEILAFLYKAWYVSYTGSIVGSLLATLTYSGADAVADQLAADCPLL